MSSTTAPARASEPPAPTGPGCAGAGSSASTRPVTTYYLLVGVTVGPRRLRPDHGAVGLGDDVAHRDRPSSAYSIFLSQLPVRRRRRGRARRRLAAAGARPGSGWPCRSSSSRSSCSCSSSPRSGVTSTATATGSRRADHAAALRVRSRSRWSWSAPRSCRPSASSSARLEPRRSCPSSFPIAVVSIGWSLLGHDLGTVLVLGGDRRRRAVRRRRPGCAGSSSPALPFAAWPCAFVVTSPNRLGRFDVWLGPRHRPSSAPPASRSTAATPSPTAGWCGVGLGASREKWELAARAAQRLHLRHHRRGARPARHAGGARPLRGAGPGLLPARHAHRRLLRPHRHGRDHDAGSSSRRSSTSARSSACCPSSGCRCRWSPRAGPRS